MKLVKQTSVYVLRRAFLIICLALGCFVVAPAPQASAHEPVFTGDYPQTGTSQTGKPLSALTVNDPDLDHVFYAALAQRNEVDAYAVTGAKGNVINAQILIPVLSSTQAFRPSLALVGPGLPTPTKSDAATLPFAIPPSAGLLLSEADPATGSQNQASARYDEPFMQTSYWKGQAIVYDMPQAGTYYLVVFGRNGATGKYALSLGNNEPFGLREFVLYPAWWVRVKLWADDYIALLIAVVVVALVIAFLCGLWVWSGAPARARKRAVRNASPADGGSEPIPPTQPDE